jgi:uncharacterized protein YndB with AHSA1/START domain
MSGQVTHRTLLFERRLEAPIETVYVALADPVTRASWSAPSDTAAFFYEETDFREGGRDVFRCGSKSNPQFTGVTTYLSILPNRRITSGEVVQSGGETLMASLITTELESDGEGTQLQMIVHVTSFAGEGMLDGSETGNNAALDNLVEHLAG